MLYESSMRPIDEVEDSIGWHRAIGYNRTGLNNLGLGSLHMLQVAWLLAGLGILTAGAEVLVRGAASLARRFGLTPLVVGLTVVAFGTSAPELIVSINGSLNGLGDIAVGNVVGSNIFNVGVILALASLIAPMRIKLSIIKIDAPIMIGVTILANWLIRTGSISRLAGLGLALLLAFYVLFSIRLAKKEESQFGPHEFEDGVPRMLPSAMAEFLFIGAGLGLLGLGSTLFVDSSVSLARMFGLSEALIGLTIVAAGTSMPELATSIVAAGRGQSDIAVGNIIGSNIFNILGILGIACMVNPIQVSGISQLDLGVMVVFAVGLLPLLWTGQQLQRFEGLLLLCGYLVYLSLLWPKS